MYSLYPDKIFLAFDNAGGYKEDVV